MITKLKRIILTLAAIVALGTPALVPAAVFAQTEIKNGLCNGTALNVDNAGGNVGCTVNDTSTNFNTLLKRIINIFSAIVGVIAVIMIIVGGLKYITSGGESSNVSGAKNTIIYALVGLIIVALAQFIVRFVLSNANTSIG